MPEAQSSRTLPAEYIAGTWTIDPVHSYVGFAIRHLMVGRVRGQFESVTGAIVLGAVIEDSQVDATINVASIHTNHAQRDEHLRSGDFFDAERYPEITFASTRFRQNGDVLYVDGAFTMRGVTRDITLTAAAPTFGGPGPEGTMVVAFAATGSISRSDFGLDFNVPMQGGGLMLGNSVGLVLDIEATLNGEPS